jgi:tetratricopeptide (TPR) repeat protein
MLVEIAQPVLEPGMSGSMSQDALAKIAAVARAGRLDEAALMVASATLGGDSDPVLAALGGAIEFHRGQFDRAIPYLEQARLHNPDDMTVRANLAESLFHTGQSAAALSLCDEPNARADRSLRLARLGGHLGQEAGDFSLAAALYRMVAAVDPSDWTIWNNLGNSLGPAGDLDGALEALGRAAKLAPDSQPIQMNLGNALNDSGDTAAAEAKFKQVADNFPDDATPLVALATLYRTQGREDEAYDAIAEAAKRAPGNAEILSDHGQEAARRNYYEVAESAYEAALALQPSLGPAYVGLASVYERMNREAELEPLRTRATQNLVDEESITYIDALRFKRAGQLEEAFAALERSGEVVTPARKLHLKGTMLDRMGRSDEAFAAFAAMNEFWKAEPTLPLERARQYRAEVEDVAAMMTSDWLDGWDRISLPPGRASPIFLVGFPRSGTTLLDTMLMADPNVRVLEEEPFIAEAEHLLGGIEAFPALGSDVIANAREFYFNRVAERVELSQETILIDKHPMHLNKVPVIHRLFPDARFILALRHPCDVLLSCFLTNFRLNNAMANFLNLEDAAALYDQSFAYWEKARALFDLPVGTIVYERLVENPQRELQPLFDWLGLNWPEDHIDHQAAARARGHVKTASYAQVTEPIYKRAAGRWSKYADHLAPIFPVIQPWVERFGYSLEDGRIPLWPVPAHQPV